MPPTYSSGYAYPEHTSRPNVRRSRSQGPLPRRSASGPEITSADALNIFLAPYFPLLKVLAALFGTLCFSSLWISHLSTFFIMIGAFAVIFAGEPLTDERPPGVVRLILFFLMFGPILRFFLAVLPLGGGPDRERKARWHYKLLAVMPVLLVIQVILSEMLGLAILSSGAPVHIARRPPSSSKVEKILKVLLEQ